MIWNSNLSIMLGLPCGPVAKTPCSQCRRHGFDPWSEDYPCGLAGKESTCNTADLGSIPGLGRSPGEGKGYPLQYSGLENSMDYTVCGVTKSQTRLSDFHVHVLETKVSHTALYSQPKKKQKQNPRHRVFLFVKSGTLQLQRETAHLTQSQS